MFAALSLLSLVVLIACGEEETKKTQAPLTIPKTTATNDWYNKLLLEKMRQTSPYNLWMVKKLSYLIIRGKSLLEVLGFMVWSM